MHFASQLDIASSAAQLKSNPSTRGENVTFAMNTDLPASGVLSSLDQRLEENEVPRQPKKRFVGRRQAAEITARSCGDGTSDGTAIEDSGAIQSSSSSSFHFAKFY